MSETNRLPARLCAGAPLSEAGAQVAQRAALSLGAVRATYYGARFPGLSSNPGDGSAACKTNAFVIWKARRWRVVGTGRCWALYRLSGACGGGRIWNESMMNIGARQLRPISAAPRRPRTMALAWAVREGLRISARRGRFAEPRSF